MVHVQDLEVEVAETQHHENREELFQSIRVGLRHLAYKMQIGRAILHVELYHRHQDPVR